MGAYSHVVEVLRERYGDVLSVEQVVSANSQVFKVRMGIGRDFLAKIYPQIPGDSRDRLGTEFAASTFMWRHGVVTIPEPILADKDHQFALYGFVNGERVTDIGTKEIDQAIELLEQLAGLRLEPDSVDLPIASEACFTFACFADQISGRVKRLQGMERATSCHREAAKFLDDEFEPLLDSVLVWVYDRIVEKKLDTNAEIPESARTLSPSDFGFHNAIRQEDGVVYFLDFEYFGWDDPAKMIVDFLLHPAMVLTPSLKERFLEQTMEVFQDDVNLAVRIELLYPLLGLNWCLIVLNEFLPGPLQRRQRASGHVPVDEVLSTQLAKSRQQLVEIQEAFSMRPPISALAGV